MGGSIINSKTPKGAELKRTTYMAIASILAKEGGVSDPVVIVAALLHDTVEDTETTQAELEHVFGDDVARIVMEVTDDKSSPKADRKRLQIEHAGHISYGAKLVKRSEERRVGKERRSRWS